MARKTARCLRRHGAQIAGTCGVRLRRETINSEWSTDVRFGAHSGIKSDIAPCPKSANMRHQPVFASQVTRCTNRVQVGLQAMVQERPVRVERRLSAILAADVAG